MIISENTVWSASELHEYGGTVQVAPDVTLTIEAGTTVQNTKLQVFGDLIVEGNSTNKVLFKNVELLFGSESDTPGHFDLQYVDWDQGSFLAPTGYGSYGSFQVNNNHFTEVEGFYIWYPQNDSKISNSTFVNSQGLSVGVRGSFTIENNNFIASERPVNGSQDLAIVNWAAYGSDMLVTGNNFYGPQPAMELPKNYGSAGIKATGNYYSENTQDGVNAKILDQNDDLSRNAIIVDNEFLLSPNNNAPDYENDDLIQGSSNAETNNPNMTAAGIDAL